MQSVLKWVMAAVKLKGELKHGFLMHDACRSAVSRVPFCFQGSKNSSFT